MRDDNGRTFYRPVFGTRNGVRLPAYYRFDVPASWESYRGEENQAHMGVSAFNLTNRKNIRRRAYNASRAFESGTI